MPSAPLARARSTSRALAAVGRGQVANAFHLARREPISTPPLRMFTVADDDAAIASHALRWPDAPDVRGARNRLERIFAAWVGSPDAVAFASGRVALSACLAALGLRPGDQVVLPAYTCLVVVNALTFAGIEPVYADIEHETFALDADAVEAAMTPRTRAIVIQHLYGLVSRDLGRVLEIAARRGVPVIEDCAQSTGARLGDRAVGTLGDVGFYSVGVGKIVEAGQGGLAVARDPAVAARLRDYQVAAAEVDPAALADTLATFLLDYAQLGAPGRWWRGAVAELRLGHRRAPGATDAELRGEKPERYEQRMPDAVAALAINQLAKLHRFAALRRASAGGWDLACAELGIDPPRVVAGSTPAFGSYPVLVTPEMKADRRWAYELFGVSLATWFSASPDAAALVGNPRAAAAYERCVCFPTSAVTPRRRPASA